MKLYFYILGKQCRTLRPMKDLIAISPETFFKSTKAIYLYYRQVNTQTKIKLSYSINWESKIAMYVLLDLLLCIYVFINVSINIQVFNFLVKVSILYMLVCNLLCSVALKDTDWLVISLLFILILKIRKSEKSENNYWKDI